jgi:hypothetical protein
MHVILILATMAQTQLGSVVFDRHTSLEVQLVFPDSHSPSLYPPLVHSS